MFFDSKQEDIINAQIIHCQMAESMRKKKVKAFVKVLISSPAWKEHKQDRQCTYNVTVRHIRETTGAVEKQRVLDNLSVCICGLSYPACNAHASYCHPWPAPLYNTFPDYLTNSMIFKKKITEHKICVLIFSTTFVQNISHSKKK